MSEHKLDVNEMALVILAGEAYENDIAFVTKYGWNPAKWPHRSILIKAQQPLLQTLLPRQFRHRRYKWATWDNKQGWVIW